VAPDDTERLYTMLRELREEVVGYRADLNGRLRALEYAESHRQGTEQGRNSIGRLVAGTAAIASGIAVFITALANYL
jgi:hypothetical protein